MADPEVVDAMLAHLKPPGVDHSMPHSLRATMFYRMLDALNDGGEMAGFSVLGLLHFDGFSPFKQKKDDHTVDYLLLRPVVHHENACLQKHVAAWVIWDGPKATPHLEPITEILRGQCVSCLKDGVVVQWPVGVRTANRSGADWEQPAPNALVVVRFTVGALVADQPATETVNGSANHNAVMACRWGSITGRCVGGNLSRDKKNGADASFSELLCLLKKKGADLPMGGKVTWHRHSSTEMVAQATVEPDPVAVALAQAAAADTRTSVSARKKSQTNTGWSSKGCFMRMLKEVNGLTDQQMDVLIDGMHNWMNVIKPLAHMTVDMLQSENHLYWLDQLLKEIRRDLPNCFTNGRRVNCN